MFTFPISSQLNVSTQLEPDSNALHYFFLQYTYSNPSRVASDRAKD